MEPEKSTNHPPPTDPSAATPTKPPPSEPRRRGKKRKTEPGNSSAPPPTKRHARERAAAAATAAATAAASAAVAASPVHSGPLTRARQSPAPPSSPAVKEEVEAVAVVVTGIGGDDVAVKVVEREEGLEAVEAKVEAEYEAIRSRDRNAHVVPNPASWFSWTSIHPVEKRTLPSFFNGKSENRTPEIYMEIRDWIMRKFHSDPNTQIEVKDLSELSVGEMDARQEVMEFLDHWGLINYHPFPETDNSVVNVNEKTTTTNSLVEILYRFEKEESCVPVVAGDNMTTPAAPAEPSRLLPEATIAEDLARQEEPEYHCNSCSADCSRKRYHCQIQADYDLCTECFSSGKFEDMSPGDFILMEPAEAAGVSGGKWTDQETLLLLEALELFSENWNEIADHVATKTKAQCILHFVQMPIEESVMVDCDNENEATNKEVVDSTKAENDKTAPKDTSEATNSEIAADVNQPESSPMKIIVSEDATGKKDGEETNQDIALKALNEAFEMVGSDPTPGGQFSFADAGNPVMALAAFLVKLTEPKIATATAHSSLKCITDNSSSIELAARHCFLLEDPPGDKKTPAEADSAVAEPVEVDAVKNEEQNKEDPIEEISGTVPGNVDVPENKNIEMDKDDAGCGKEALRSSKNKSRRKSKTAKRSSSNESDKAGSCKDQDKSDTKESDKSAPKIDTQPSSPMVPVEDKTDKLDSPKSSVANESKDLNEKVEVPSSPAKEPSDKANESSQQTESVKDEDAAPGALSAEIKKGDEESKDNKNKNQGPETTTDEPNIDKLKRVAVTAISAAAVKAKLLADQEEDQIRQLATLLIDKQLHKLETKLAFFNDLDTSVMRVRDQMEKCKQKLYQERAQIIATRFGLPQSSSRPMQPPPSLPINRVAMGFANSAARPPMGMNMMMPSQRPSMMRPMMTSPPSSTFVPPSTTVGFSARPNNPDKN